MLFQKCSSKTIRIHSFNVKTHTHINHHIHANGEIHDIHDILIIKLILDLVLCNKFHKYWN